MMILFECVQYFKLFPINHYFFTFCFLVLFVCSVCKNIHLIMFVSEGENVTVIYCVCVCVCVCVLSINILILNVPVSLCRSLILKSTWIRSETYWTVKIYLTCKHEHAVDEPADCPSRFSVEDKPGCSRGQEQGSFCQGTCSTLIQYTVLYYAVSVLQ